MAQRTPWGRGLPASITALIVLLATAVMAAACSTGGSAAPMSTATALSSPTFYGDVQSIVSVHCTKCHYTGGIGPFPLETFDDAHSMADAISAAVTSRAMPPWGAQTSTECSPPFPWRDDERLSLDEIDLIRRWAAAGAQAGDPTNVAAALSTGAPPDSDTSLVNPDYDLAPRSAYTPSTAEQDDFHCFVFDMPPDLAPGGYLSSIAVVPSVAGIVHHANVYADTSGVSAARAGPNGDFACAGGEIVEPTSDGQQPALSWLLAWAPGARPTVLPENLGIFLPPNARVVMEVHYSTANKAVAADRTHVQLSLTKEKPGYTLSSWAIGNEGPAPGPDEDGLQPGPDDRDGVTEFRVPAGSPSHPENEVSTFHLDAPIAIYGVRGHAHLAADDIKVDVLRKGSTEEDCLLQDKWDFHWQRAYSYEAPLNALPLINDGDRVRVRCTYNDTMLNPRLGEELYERQMQPRDIFYGDDTLDEMCLAELLFVVKTP